MRGKICRIYRVGLFVSLATALLATSWGDGEIILLDGSRIAVQRYEIKDKHIVFMTVEGKLQSLPLVYVDLLATTGKKEFSGKALTRQPNSNLRDQSIDYHNSHLERTLLIQKVQSEILLDAVLDEADWDYAPVAKNFIQSEPVEGKPATYDTEVRVLYDESHLYFGVLAYDSEPTNLVITDLTRDYNTRSVDTFGIVLDTFHDRRNSYMFQTNPAGSKFDGQSFNEGQVFNRDWDGVWHVKARVTEQGWIAEFAIPLKTLKFRSLEQQTWGVNFLRRNRRLNEDSHWAPIPRIHTSTRVSIAGTLKGLRDLKPGTSFRVSPYARGDAEQNTGTGRLHELTGGVDAKIGVGTGLTLDLTVNTDFSEIESDVQQVNLSRFSLFFPEKRDFFLENSGIFRFGPPEDSRRRRFRTSYGLGASGGGRGGQVRGDDLLLFFSRRIGLSNEGSPVPVLGGGRLTGRTGNYEIGLLNIQTGEQEGVSKGTNFTVARVKRNIFQNSDVGFMFVNKATMGSDAYNRSFGFDTNLRLNAEMDVNAYVAKTATPGLEGRDMAGRLAYRYTGRTLAFGSSFSILQENFNPETGFAPRRGIRRSSGNIQYNYRQPWAREILREIRPSVDLDYFTDQNGTVVSRYLNYRLTFRLQSGGFLSIGRYSNVEQLFESFEINPNVAIASGFYKFNDYFATLFTDPSRVFTASVRGSKGNFYSGKKTSASLGGALKIAPRFSVEANWSYNKVNLKEGLFTTQLLTARTGYSFSTSIFLNALVQYNSTTKQIASNIRFNLIHRPLSNVFVVYNDIRDESGKIVDRMLIAKFTYLFDF